MSRYQDEQVTKNVPCKVLHYIPLFHSLNDYSGVVAWHNLWITMSEIEVKMT